MKIEASFDGVEWKLMGTFESARMRREEEIFETFNLKTPVLLSTTPFVKFSVLETFGCSQVGFQERGGEPSSSSSHCCTINALYCCAESAAKAKELLEKAWRKERFDQL